MATDMFRRSGPMRDWLGRFVVATLPFLLAPILVLVVIWYPEISHYRPRPATVEAAAVGAARTVPDDAVLREVGTFTLIPIEDRTPGRDVSVADEMLAGRLALPGQAPASVGVPFDAADLERLPASLQLAYAGFVVPDFLLSAYRETGDEAYFAAARDFILAWGDFERGAWLPTGLLWNDHAVSARVRVLGEFWRLYRSRGDYRADVGQAVLEQAARYGWFLSDPGQFTFATNHGMMQNLGLLELALLFPTLPEASTYRTTAIDRLTGQLTFLIDQAGAFRENSAGYQAFDLRVLSMSLRCFTLLGERVPDALSERYAAAIRFLDTLRRPDGTVPANGDTDGAPIDALLPTLTDISPEGVAGPLHQLDPPAAAPDTLDPDGGYWIRWSGLTRDQAHGPSQTVVTWTTPPGPGHKHADELSALVWSQGVSWLTSVGYWPYDDQRRDLAESWVGSNAPHLSGEATGSARSTSVLGHAASEQLGVGDVQRSGPGDLVIRRQVVNLGSDTWIVLDTAQGVETGDTETVWTLSPDVSLEQAGSATFALRVGADGPSARMDLVGSAGVVTESYLGSTAPFAGWHVVAGIPRPAPAVRVRQPGPETWLAVVLSTSRTRSADEPTISFESADSWTISMDSDVGSVKLSRSGPLIDARLGDAGELVSLDLGPVPPTQDDAAARAGFASMAGQYPAYRSLVTRRAYASVLVVGLAAAEQILVLVVGFHRRRLVPWLRVLALGGWLVLGLLLALVVLQSWTVLA